MKTLNQYIQEKLIINKDYREAKIVVKSFDELRKIIVDRYKKLGPGTKQNPIDFNDIDVSNLDSFYINDKGLFEGTKFKYIDISEWNVLNVKSMNSMFFDCAGLESVGDLSSWDVSNVIDMSFMFCDCNCLNPDVSSWDVSNVTDMRSMFYRCKKFNQDISSWNVSSVNNMNSMFAYCKIFNQDISDWDVSNVRDKTGIFDCCSIEMKYMPKFK